MFPIWVMLSPHKMAHLVSGELSQESRTDVMFTRVIDFIDQFLRGW